MKAFFRAVGLDFHKNLVVGPFETVNVYPLMCHLLGIKPEINDGSLDNTRYFLISGGQQCESKGGFVLRPFLFTTIDNHCIAELKAKTYRVILNFGNIRLDPSPDNYQIISLILYGVTVLLHITQDYYHQNPIFLLTPDKKVC